METNYEALVNKRCRHTETGEEMYVLGLFTNPPTVNHPTGRMMAHVDGVGIPRGTMVNPAQLELA